MYRVKNSAVVLFVLMLLSTPFAYAQEVHQDLQGSWKAKVAEIVKEEDVTLEGLDILAHTQTLRAELLEGPKTGEIITVENDFTKLKVGDRFYVQYLITVNGGELYTAGEPYRIPALTVLTLIFVVAVIIFGGWQGVRSLGALAFSFAALFYVLFPLILRGMNPVLVGTIFASLVLTAAIFFTHGVNRKSTAALLGTLCTIAVTVLFAEFAVAYARLSGFVEDASVYLNTATKGLIDFQGLLLAAMIIGVLGVLDDIAITQAAAVSELADASPNMKRKELYARALVIGREHVGALVNTLALAYAGAALPLLLFFYTSTSDVMLSINREIFAAEIVRTIAGSIAIILTVPITTLIAVWLLAKKSQGNTEAPGL
ncbi:MAG: YibE/F family protein [Patescibacteria group bacterium]